MCWLGKSRFPWRRRFAWRLWIGPCSPDNQIFSIPIRGRSSPARSSRVGWRLRSKQRTRQLDAQTMGGPMPFARSQKYLTRVFVLSALLWAASASVLAQQKPGQAAASEDNPCPNDDSGLALPPGFCATVFADNIGHARHMVVASDGVVYVNTWSGRYYGNDTPPAGGFLVALQDKSGSGKAGTIERFGETVQTGGAGGTGIGLYKGALYAEINDRIVRYTLPAAAILPTNSMEIIVSGLPLGADHPMHPFVIDAQGSLYVDVASATNSCQEKNRTLKSPGLSPCVELETRGGIWRYDANKTNQTFSPADRYATGIRNGEGFAIDSN